MLIRVKIGMKRLKHPQKPPFFGDQQLDSKQVAAGLNGEKKVELRADKELQTVSVRLIGHDERT